MTDNRTTELREKLTERGVDWIKPKSAAEFIQTTFLHDGWGIEVLERNIGLCVTATNVFDTPEQAIAATLGESDEGCYLMRDGKKFPVELDYGFLGILPISIKVAGFRYLLEVPNGE